VSEQEANKIAVNKCAAVVAELSEIKVADAQWSWTKMKFLVGQLGKMRDF